MFEQPDDVETYLGILDAVFMVSYAVVCIAFRILYLLGWGMLGHQSW